MERQKQRPYRLTRDLDGGSGNPDLVDELRRQRPKRRVGSLDSMETVMEVDGEPGGKASAKRRALENERNGVRGISFAERPASESRKPRSVSVCEAC